MVSLLFSVALASDAVNEFDTSAAVRQSQAVLVVKTGARPFVPIEFDYVTDKAKKKGSFRENRWSYEVVEVIWSRRGKELPAFLCTAAQLAERDLSRDVFFAETGEPEGAIHERYVNQLKWKEEEEIVNRELIVFLGERFDKNPREGGPYDVFQKHFGNCYRELGKGDTSLRKYVDRAVRKYGR